MAIPVPAGHRASGGGSRQLRIAEPSTVNRKSSSRKTKSSPSAARASSQLLPLCAHPSLRNITNKLTAIQVARTESRYSSATSASVAPGTGLSGSSYHNNTPSLPVQLPKVPKPRPKLSDIPPAHRAVWGKFVKGKVPVPGKVKHDKLCGRCGERSHRNAGGNGPFGEAFRVPDASVAKDGKPGNSGNSSSKNTNQRTITTTTTKTSSVPGNPKMTTTTSVTTTTGPPSSSPSNPAPLPIQLYAPDCVLFDDPSALDDFRPRYTRPGPPPPPPMMGGRRRPRRHDQSSAYNNSASVHPHSHVHCNCATKRSTDPQLIASIQAYIHTLFTLKYAYHDLPHSFFDKVREAEKGLIPLLLRDGVVDVARRRGDLGETTRKHKSANAKRDIAVAGTSSSGTAIRTEKPAGLSTVDSVPLLDSSGLETSPTVKPPLSRANSHDSRGSGSADGIQSDKVEARNDGATEHQRGAPYMTPDLSLNLKLDDFPTPEMVFDMREEMRDVVGEFLSDIFITTATDMSDHIALLADIHGYDSLSCGPPCVCTLSACLPCIINLQFRLINDELVKPFPRDPPDTALVRWSVKAIRGSMISTEAIIGDPKKESKGASKARAREDELRKMDAAKSGGKPSTPYIPIEEIMRQIDASDERDRFQLQEAQRRMGDELWRIALEMDLQVLAKREIKALKEVPDDEFVTLLNEACSPNPEDEHEEEHRLMDLWDEWTSHIPPIDPDYTESEEKDYIEAEKEKKNGNEAFTKGLYRRAIRHFTNAIELDPDQPVYPLNRAAAYLKLERWEHAQRDCTTCITLDPRNSKAYYRRALARRAMGYLFDAERDLQAVLALEPKSVAFQIELKDIQELIAHTAETSASSRMTGLRAIPEVQDSKEAKADREANEIKLKQRFDRTVKEKFADIESRPSKNGALTRQRSSSGDNLCDMHQFEACLKYGLPEPTCPCGEDHDWDDSDGSYEEYDDEEEEDDDEEEASEDYSDIEEEAATAAEQARARMQNASAGKSSGAADQSTGGSLANLMPLGGNLEVSADVTETMQDVFQNPRDDSFDQFKQCFADNIYAAMAQYQESQGL